MGPVSCAPLVSEASSPHQQSIVRAFSKSRSPADDGPRAASPSPSCGADAAGIMRVPTRRWWLRAAATARLPAGPRAGTASRSGASPRHGRGDLTVTSAYISSRERKEEEARRGGRRLFRLSRLVCLDLFQLIFLIEYYLFYQFYIIYVVSRTSSV